MSGDESESPPKDVGAAQSNRGQHTGVRRRREGGFENFLEKGLELVELDRGEEAIIMDAHARLLASSPTALATLLAPLTPRDAIAASGAGDWSSPGLAAEDPLPDVKYVKTGDGLVYEQVNQGAGAPAKAGDIAVFHWIIRRANGYFIYGSIDCGIGCGNGDPSEYKLGPDGSLIAGLDELLTGMQPGEKRRALVPPALGYVRKGMEPQPPDFGQKRQVEAHSNEPLVFEVKLIKTRSAA